VLYGIGNGICNPDISRHFLGCRNRDSLAMRRITILSFDLLSTPVRYSLWYIDNIWTRVNVS
jgi:hypothetical protein